VPFGASMLAADIIQVQTHFKTGIDDLVPRSSGEARRMAGWLNRGVRSDDMVIVMPQIAWLLHCRTAEILQSVASTGVGSSFYPSGLERARFAYDPGISQAKFLVVDEFTRIWIKQNRPARSIVAHVAATWPVAYRHGEYLIYENPKYGHSGP
jgi:hypothetical protein